MLVLTRFRVPVGGQEQADLVEEAERALAALSARPGCLSARLGRGVDDPDLWVLATRWEGAGAYRRALSSAEVKMAAVPLLSRCLDEPTAFEVLAEASGGDVVRHPGALAADAATTGPGASDRPGSRR